MVWFVVCDLVEVFRACGKVECRGGEFFCVVNRGQHDGYYCIGAIWSLSLLYPTWLRHLVGDDVSARRKERGLGGFRYQRFSMFGR